MSLEARYHQIRNLIETAGSRFVSITFIKKDGTRRQIDYNPKAAAKKMKGNLASESAQQAAKTRSTNNPNLLNVWDNRKRAFRSINMDTITEIRIDGETWKFTRPR